MFIEPKVSIINGWTNECRLDVDFQEFCLQVLFECVSKDRPALLQVRTVCWKVENFTVSSGSVFILSSKLSEYEGTLLLIWSPYYFETHLFCREVLSGKAFQWTDVATHSFKINSSEIGFVLPQCRFICHYTQQYPWWLIRQRAVKLLLVTHSVYLT